MVYILLADGFEEAEALVTADLLRRGGCAVTLVGLDDLQVTGAHHITVLADTTLAQVDADEIEMLVLPRGLGGVENIQMTLFALKLSGTAAPMWPPSVPPPPSWPILGSWTAAGRSAIPAWKIRCSPP